MFGNNPISSAPFTSLSSKKVAQLLSVLSTATVSIAAMAVVVYTKLLTVLSTSAASIQTLRGKLLSVSSTGVVSLQRSIKKIITYASSTVVIVSIAGIAHLISMQIASTATVTISKLLSLSKTLTVLSSSIVSIIKAISKNITISVNATVSIIRNFFKTITVTVTAIVSLVEGLIFPKIISVLSTSTASIGRSSIVMLTVVVNSTIYLFKQISKILLTFVPIYVTILADLVPKFGAVFENVIYAPVRKRLISLIKNRSIFSSKDTNNYG